MTCKKKKYPKNTDISLPHGGLELLVLKKLKNIHFFLPDIRPNIRWIYRSKMVFVCRLIGKRQFK